MECKYCDCNVPYVPCANFILFCPDCKREIYMECEYGYGPVTPCSILLGEDLLGTVTVNDKNEYLLEVESDKKHINLRERYLNALQEASQILKARIRPKENDMTPDLIKIIKEGGSLCFYGDWFGRPGDNYHRVRGYSLQDNVLEIVFDQWERLIVFEPVGIVNTENEFVIQQAKKIKWSWYPYGSSEKEMNKISYELTGGVVHKNSKYGEQCFEIKEPYFAVLLG